MAHGGMFDNCLNLSMVLIRQIDGQPGDWDRRGGMNRERETERRKRERARQRESDCER